MADNYKGDLNPEEFVSELETVKFQIDSFISESESKTSLDLLQAIHDFFLIETCPNVDIALRIFLRLPVPTA